MQNPMGARVSSEQALDLLKNADTAELMSLADGVRRAKYGLDVFYVHSLNLNPTNVCENQCGLCAFWREEGSEKAYTLSPAQIRDRLEQLHEVEKRRAYILKTIEEQGKLNPELKKSLKEAETMAALEDLYLPYKPKRRTRATVAREKGLEPLAKLIYDQKDMNLEELAGKFINPEKEVQDVEEALQGARDIMAEWIAEDVRVRDMLRNLFYREGILSCKNIKGKEMEGIKYKDYFDFSEPVKKVPSHRLLAMRRGEKESFLSIDIQPDEGTALRGMEKLLITARNSSAEQVETAIQDGYKRLLKPSMETEIRMQTKKEADIEAITVFVANLRQLLLAPSSLGCKEGQKCPSSHDGREGRACWKASG